MKLKDFLVVTLLFPAGITVAIANVDVKVMTWNIKRGIGTNTPNAGEQSYIAKIVNYLRPDIWNVNELGGNSPGYSASSEHAALSTFIAGNLTIFGSHPVEGRDYYVYVGGANDGYIGNAIVSRFPLSGMVTYVDGLRGLVHADVALPGGVTLGDFTEHLKATSNGSDSTSDSEKRQSESEASSASLRSWFLNHPGSPAVLTGDCNLSEDPGEDDNWTAGNIGDLLPNGHPYQPITTLKSAGFLDPKPLSVNGDPDTIDSGTSHPRNRFDYNLYSTSKLISYQTGQVFNTAAYPYNHWPVGFSFGDSGYASDHLPVLADYSIVPEPASLTTLSLALLGFIRRRRLSQTKHQ